MHVGHTHMHTGAHTALWFNKPQSLCTVQSYQWLEKKHFSEGKRVYRVATLHLQQFILLP